MVWMWHMIGREGKLADPRLAPQQWFDMMVRDQGWNS